MKKNVTLSIPNPCAEKWETFTSTATGAYCGSCQKVVVDFTKMADPEIINFLSERESTCGRIHASQLRSYVYTPSPRISPGFTLLKAGVLSALFLLFSKPTPAQIPTEKTKTELTNQMVNPANALPASDTSYQVKGTVLADEDHSSLAGVNILLQGSTEGTTTDAEGKFVFPKKLKPGDVLLFSFIGLETQVFTIPKNLSGSLEIQMKMEFILMGKLQMIGDNAKPSALHKLWSKVKSVF